MPDDDPSDRPPDDRVPDDRLDDDLLGPLAEALRAPDRSPAPHRVADLRRQVEARRRLAGESAGAVVSASDVALDAPADEVLDRRQRRDAEEARRRSRRALLRGGAAAGIGVVAGAAGVFALTTDDGGGATDPAPPTEPVAFASVPEGLTVDGRTIDHTWGMELLLDVQGLPAGAEYEVRYATEAGPVAAGGFVAVDVPMRCRFNGTALRSAVTAIDVVDTATGTSVLTGTIS